VRKRPSNPPVKQGLYDPRHEHDSCGLGFVVDIQGRKSRRILQQAIEVLANLEHRGACGCETNTGDGAGILLQIPHAFFVRECPSLNLPAPDDYAIGMVFLPTESKSRRECEELFEQIAREEGQTVLGWRTVPTEPRELGPTAVGSQPIIRQGLEILNNLSHRGATGADPLQGDGAGILIQLPDAFLRRACGKLAITLPTLLDFEYSERIDDLSEDACHLSRAINQLSVSRCNLHPHTLFA